VFALREITPRLANVKLDYSSTPERVSSIATEALLRNDHRGLRGLQQWFQPQASSQLPSWVFDFTHVNIAFNENGETPALDHEIVLDSDASAGSFLRVAQCNMTSIHVAGFIVDEILDISPPIDHTERQDTRWLTQTFTWQRLAQAHFPAHMGFKHELGTYTRGVVRTLGSGPGPAQWANQHHPFTLAGLLLYGSSRWEDGPKTVLNNIFSSSFKAVAAHDDEEFEKTKSFMLSLESNANRAKFFVTKSLRVGLAPLSAAIGDRIAILASGNAPFALRPVPVNYAGEEAYRIMGGCYVDGMLVRDAKSFNSC
jgi:hypothetical protein